jgi:hypothetical protein
MIQIRGYAQELGGVRCFHVEIPAADAEERVPPHGSGTSLIRRGMM